jgi:hypothetical protein
MRLRRLLDGLNRLDKRLPRPRHPWDWPPIFLNVYLHDGEDEEDMPAWQRAFLPRHPSGRRLTCDDLRAELLPRGDLSGLARHLLMPQGGDDEEGDPC